MKYINVFETEEAYNASAGSLAKPQLACIGNGKIYSLSEGGQPGPTPTVNWVDLGLPSGTLWADRNVGATCADTSTSWYGGYYAWGETATKTNYAWSTYKHCNKDKENLIITKYTDANSSTLLQEDDAAYTNGQVIMPTKEQCQELIDGTNSSWVETYNGIEGLNGMLFINKSNENVSIFIPAAGLYEGNVNELTQIICVVWSSTVSSDNYRRAFNLFAESDDIYISDDDLRFGGISIRGVKSSN